MSQEPLRQSSRLKKVQDTEDVITLRQTSRVLGTPRSAPTRSGTSSRVVRARAGEETGGLTAAGGIAAVAAGGLAASAVEHGHGQSLPLSLVPPLLSALPPSQSPMDPPILGGDIAQVADVSDVSLPQEELISDYWYALTHVGGVFRLENHHYVFQDWDSKTESLKVCWMRVCCVFSLTSPFRRLVPMFM